MTEDNHLPIALTVKLSTGAVVRSIGFPRKLLFVPLYVVALHPSHTPTSVKMAKREKRVLCSITTDFSYLLQK